MRGVAIATANWYGAAAARATRVGQSHSGPRAASMTEREAIELMLAKAIVVRDHGLCGPTRWQWATRWFRNPVAQSQWELGPTALDDLIQAGVTAGAARPEPSTSPAAVD